MFAVQNPPLDHPEPLFYLTTGMGAANPTGSEATDFCIWVLERDGLRVPPFDQHPDGDGSLRSQGMTADAWQSWLMRTALLIDQRRHWHTDLLAMESQADQLREFQQMQQQIQAEYPDLELPPLNAPALVEQIDRHANWQAEQAEKFKPPFVLFMARHQCRMCGQGTMKLLHGKAHPLPRIKCQASG